MKIHLSNNDQLRTFDVFLRNFDPTDPTRLDITTDNNWINAHPAVLAAVASLGVKVDPEKITIDEIVGKSGSYLETMGLFKILRKKSPFKADLRESSGKFIPITQIKTPKQQTHFIQNIVPLLHLDPDKAEALKYTLGELVRNVLEHSESEHGAIVAATYSPEKGIVRIGICDTGIRIKGSMSYTWPARTKTDLDAVKWALVPGVSGTTMKEGGTAENAGAGLFFVKSISLVTRNYFLIYSGSAVYKLLKRRPDVKSIRLNSDPDKDRNTQTNDAPEFPGTLIAIDISVEKIKEFSSLLELIRGAFSTAIKERRTARFKPRFI